MDLVMKPPTEEILTEEDLKHLLQTNDKPGHYVGYEISGFLHIGSLILAGTKINDLIKAGFKAQVYLATWHSIINNKLGSDEERIRKAAKYYEEAFKFFCPGVKVVHGDQLYHNNDEFWRDVIRFSKRITLARNTRCLTIMGRSESDKLDMAQYFYPPMQAVDIKHIGAQLAHGGMDQRKIHVLAREEYPHLGWGTPIALHHHLLAGLAQPAPETRGRMDAIVDAKMSKSKPWTAIFIHDSEHEIQEKVAKGWCPEKVVEGNPIIDYIKHLVFPNVDTFVIPRPAKFGGPLEIKSFIELEKLYTAGKIHPQDLKTACAIELNKIVRPVREHFEKPANKKLLDVYREVEVTR
jgi:tyrosyl-tRNA synthetase